MTQLTPFSSHFSKTLQKHKKRFVFTKYAFHRIRRHQNALFPYFSRGCHLLIRVFCGILFLSSRLGRECFIYLILSSLLVHLRKEKHE